MKSQVPVIFNDWLTLMESAYETLTKEQFYELEEKIKHEISHHRETSKRGGAVGIRDRRRGR